MSSVVETALSVLLERLVNELLSISPKLLTYRKKSADEVDKWQVVLRDFRPFLRDAEKRKSSDSQIEAWLDDLEDIAYDVDDLLEEFEHDVMQIQSQGKKPKRTILDWVSSQNKKFQSKSKVLTELQSMTDRLHNIVERKKGLNLLWGEPMVTMQRTSRHPSGPVSAERILYGREREKKEISDFLKKVSHCEHRVEFLAVVGMGGVGKTTLAQHIFNDDEVISSFTLRAWVCVSKDLDLRKIFNCILKAVANQSHDLVPDIEYLQGKLADVLKEEKFFIVLDDLWNDDVMTWELLNAPFKCGAAGSKVLVTTRDANVAKLVKTVDQDIDLQRLSENDWLKLFCSHVRIVAESGSNSRQTEVRKELYDRCGGLPLAATILGSLLRGKGEEESWKAILNYDSLISKKGQSQMDSVLKMSYDDLPYYLKSCFVYCGIFPEDYEFEENHLVQLWIAAGIVKSDNQKDTEEHGHSYFNDLVSRSLLTLSCKQNRVYVMHDLVRDMCRKILHSKCYRLENDKDLALLVKARHVSIDKSIIANVMSRIEDTMPPLRTLVILSGQYKIENLKSNLFSKLTRLRVLHVEDVVFHVEDDLYFTSVLTRTLRQDCDLLWKMKHLKYLCMKDVKGLTGQLSNIGNLAQLNWLDLSGCSGLTGELPCEIGNLTHLTLLDLSGCRCITGALPKEIGKLTQLTWFNLFGCNGLTGELPREIGNLTKLVRLDLSYCSGLMGKLPIEIGNLTHLNRLDLSSCSGFTGELPADIGNLTHLTRLDLSGCSGFVGNLPKELGNLSRLTWLGLSGCSGLTGELPQEIGNLIHLTKLDLLGCNGLAGDLPKEMRNLTNLTMLLLPMNLRRCID